jgi:hypothetical protein
VLYKRADHKNPKWTVRLKIPTTSGFVVKSTKTTDDFEARRFSSSFLRLDRTMRGTLALPSVACQMSRTEDSQKDVIRLVEGWGAAKPGQSLSDRS